VLRTWRYGGSKVTTVDDDVVLKFYNTYKGQVWNEQIEETGRVNSWDYTSLYLTDDSLVPVCYLYFGEAVQKVLTYQLESEMEQ
jgi:pyruvate dehydrogenase complex dehydrogenase (E1) component